MPAYHGVRHSAVSTSPRLRTDHQAFKTWIETSSGMLQHIVWTALCAEGMGASLQVCPLLTSYMGPTDE